IQHVRHGSRKLRRSLLEGSEYRGLPHTGMPVQGNHRSLRLPVRQRIKNPTPISLVSSFHLPGPDSNQSQKQDHIAAALPAPPAHHYQITAPLGKGFNRPEIERQTTADRIHSPEPRLSGSLLLVGNTYFRTLTIIQQGYVDGTWDGPVRKLLGRTNIHNHVWAANGPFRNDLLRLRETLHSEPTRNPS